MNEVHNTVSGSAQARNTVNKLRTPPSSWRRNHEPRLIG